MKNLFANLTASAKLSKNLSKNDTLRFDRVISIPGYSELTDANQIFVQKTKQVWHDGIKAEIYMAKTSNPEYVVAHGEYFFIVGESFVKMSHRKQLAMIANELMRNGIEIGNMFMVDMKSSEDVILQAAGMGDTEIEDVEILTNEQAARLIVLSGIFGKRTACAVINHEIRAMKSTAKYGAKIVAKEAKKTKAGYQRKTFKGEVKPAKKANVAVVKSTNKADSATEKVEKKAAKAGAKTAKATKKAQTKVNKADAAKEKANPLDSAAAGIDNDTNMNGAEPAMA